MKNKKLMLGLAVALAIVMTLSGTFAWFTTQQSAINKFKTDSIADGSVNLVEVFTPPEDWRPGETIVKDVSVVNNGEGDVLVRVSFEEVMRALSVPAIASGSAYAGGTAIPQTSNIAAYTSANGWTAPGAGYTVSGLPAGVTMLMKTATSGSGSSLRYAYSFFFFAPVSYNGNTVNQKVTADVAVSGTPGNITLTVSNAQFYAFAGVTTTTAAWANFAVPTLPTYTPPLSATPAVRPLADISWPATDMPGGVTAAGKMIEIIYGSPAGLSTITPNTWFYNAADGFFYYIGKLESGAMSTSLITALVMDDNAGLEYASMEFDLVVNMEAIQNTYAAITSAWNLSGALATALDAYCS